MDKIKKLVRLGWLRWYVWLALVVAIGLTGTILWVSVDASRHVAVELSTEQRSVWDRFSLLCSLDYCLDNFFECVISPTVIVLFSGFSLDAGYKWLRKLRTAKTPES
jgi:hypothetical protein